MGDGVGLEIIELFPSQEKAKKLLKHFYGKVKIIGINSESNGISTLIGFFEIGGVDLGNVRVVIGRLHPKFENSIILGMNAIIWYNFAVNHTDKTITMMERKFKTFDISTRFTIKNITNVNLAAFEVTDN